MNETKFMPIKITWDMIEFIDIKDFIKVFTMQEILKVATDNQLKKVKHLDDLLYLISTRKIVKHLKNKGFIIKEPRDVR